ncbi:MAG: hypothetical protein ACTHK4_17570 [Mycobacteriales bacterium]
MASDSSGHDVAPGIWVATFVIIAGTIVGGIALIEWNWPAFWVGVALTVGGSIWAWLAGIMESVTEFGPGPEHN